MKSSEIINDRLKSIFKDKEYDEFFREEYSKLFKECLDIADIDYYVTAVGVLGKALENQIVELTSTALKNKTQFQINSNSLTIGGIRKILQKTNHFNRLKLFAGEEVTIDHNRLKLKKHILKKDDYHELDAIRDARNDAFHGCSEERASIIKAKALTYLERGIVVLAQLEMLNKN